MSYQRLYNKTSRATNTPASSESFLPIEGARARWLFLGTMPGQASLKAGRYYAHPRNAFWPIVHYLIDGTEPNYRKLDNNTYQACVERALQQGIAIWDVLASCERPGSLDSAIVKDSEVPNDIPGFARRHPELELIVCNGKTAERLLNTHILSISDALAPIRRVTVPSSSPAMASLSLLDKASEWKRLIVGN